jgi:hypothetical protein
VRRKRLQPELAEIVVEKAVQFVIERAGLRPEVREQW